MSLSVQFLTLSYMIASGIYLGIAYTTFKRLTSFSHSTRVTQYFLELTFWTGQMFLIYFLLVNINQGVLRFYLFLACFCGFSMYKALFEGRYTQFLESCIKVIKVILRYSYLGMKRFIFQPLIFILSIPYLVILAIVKLVFRIFNWIGRFFFILFRPLLKLFPENIYKYLLSFVKICSKIGLRRFWLGKKDKK